MIESNLPAACQVTQATGVPPIFNLSFEVVMQIFSRLESWEASSVSLSCKAFYVVIEQGQKELLTRLRKESGKREGIRSNTLIECEWRLPHPASLVVKTTDSPKLQIRPELWPPANTPFRKVGDMFFLNWKNWIRERHLEVRQRALITGRAIEREIEKKVSRFKKWPADPMLLHHMQLTYEPRELEGMREALKQQDWAILLYKVYKIGHLAFCKYTSELRRSVEFAKLCVTLVPSRFYIRVYGTDPFILHWMGDLQNNFEVVLQSVKTAPRSIHFASPQLRHEWQRLKERSVERGKKRCCE